MLFDTYSFVSQMVRHGMSELMKYRFVFSSSSDSLFLPDFRGASNQIKSQR